MKLGQLAEDILYLSEHGYEFECDPEPIGGSIWLEMPTIGLQIAYSADSEVEKIWESIDGEDFVE